MTAAADFKLFWLVLIKPFTLAVKAMLKVEKECNKLKKYKKKVS